MRLPSPPPRAARARRLTLARVGASIFGEPYPAASRVDVKLKPYPGDALANNDRSSLAAFYNAREQAVREQIIAHQMVQVHRSKVGDASARVRERARTCATLATRSPFAFKALAYSTVDQLGL